MLHTQDVLINNLCVKKNQVTLNFQNKDQVKNELIVGEKTHVRG